MHILRTDVACAFALACAHPQSSAERHGAADCTQRTDVTCRCGHALDCDAQLCQPRRLSHAARVQALLGVLGTDWQTKAAAGAAGAAAGAPAAATPAATPLGSPTQPDHAGSDMDTATGDAAAGMALETSASEITTVNAETARGAAAAAAGRQGSASLAGVVAATAAEAGAGGGGAAHTPVATQVRRSLRRLSLPQTAAVEAGGPARGGLRGSLTLPSADGADAWEEEILAEASVAEVAAAAEEEEEEGAQACTEANQHIVAGALDFVEQSRSSQLPALLRRRPEVARALLLAMTVALRYDTRVRRCTAPPPALSVAACMPLLGIVRLCRP